MQFLNHDYYSNFEGAVKSGDVDLTIDLWVNEVSDIIMSDAGKVIDLLNKVGIKTELDVSDEEIVESIMDNIAINSKLNKGISFLIAEFNGMIKGSDWKQKVDNVADTYKTLLDKALMNPTTSGSIKNDIMKQIKAKADAKGDYKRIIFKQVKPEAQKKKTNKKALYIIGGILVLTAIGIGIYYYRKNKRLKLADGGSLPLDVNGLGTASTTSSIGTTGMNASTPAPTPMVNNNVGNITPTAVTPTPVPTNNVMNPTPTSNLHMV